MSALAEPTRDGNWIDWGGSGPTLHFAHANGFPPATYRRLFEVFKIRFHVVSMEARPLWPASSPTEVGDWSVLAKDLRDELGRRGVRGCVGVGHSLGAVCSLLAAVEDPGLFSTVVAIDPIVLTGWHSRMWGAMKRIGIGDALPIVRGAVRRRDRWPDRETARIGYLSKKMFRWWDLEVFDDYLHHGIVPGPDGGVVLRYSKRWEAQVFRVSPHDLWPILRRMPIPTIFVEGEHTDTFLPAAAARVGREVPDARVLVIPDSSHFVPMEKPEEMGRAVMNAIDGVRA
jgi:pimeloyl-ACP methyl ester carboxylesterase